MRADAGQDISVRLTTDQRHVDAATGPGQARPGLVRPGPARARPARLGSFTAAGERLGFTQSAVSRHLPPDRHRRPTAVRLAKVQDGTSSAHEAEGATGGPDPRPERPGPDGHDHCRRLLLVAQAPPAGRPPPAGHPPPARHPPTPERAYRG
ncbi:LysR family transcriptional regulator [Kitasatospora sp. NPDC094011]|uniref:helix-turn-helix domain-containing protein n=1 Tax=Kitasatospora sp. NPDC094011 TaxID=3364090 RepID=UPI003813AB7C